MENVARVTKPSKEPPIVRIMLPVQQFIRAEAIGGILLLLFTGLALVWANSPLVNTYTDLWHTHLVIGVGDLKIDKDLVHWINDGLMAVFFFVVGLEIKREVLIGELKSPRKATLPIAAALGGMAVPAALYVALNAGKPGADGWGTPMATDIAFALGIMALLGKRVPLSLKVFLTALAIVDDIGAVLVIALFYTAEISWPILAVGAGFLLAMLIANRLGIRHPLVYGVIFIGLWVAFLKSGVHATVAGILAAMTIPARTLINADEFMQKAQFLLGEFERGRCGECVLPNRQQRGALQAMETIIQQAESPLQRLEHMLHPWVTLLIMPIFALANAGVALGGDLGEALTGPVALGIVIGLLAGKPLGITLAAWLAVKSGIADLPKGLNWRQIAGTGWLAGVGFTMALFIANLAYGEGALLATAKVGILAGSLISSAVGLVLLRMTALHEEKRAGRKATF